MDSFSDSDEDSRFFDAPEHIVQESDDVSKLSSTEDCDYELWTSIPRSVRERRSKFIRWMLSPESECSVEARGNGDGSLFVGDICRIMEDDGAVLGTSGMEEKVSSSLSSLCGWNADDLDVPRGVSSNDLSRASNCGTEFRGEDWGNGLDQFRSCGEFEAPSSPSVQQLARRGIQFNSDSPKFIDRLMDRWLNRWRSMSCVMRVNVKDDNDDAGLHCFGQSQGKKIRRVKVQHCRKKLKELSGLFTGQDIQAHDGSILSMKFSLDGQYLASAGEDMIVRIWQVVEDERSETTDFPDADPSCVYFSVNHLSELAPRVTDKDKVGRSMGMKKTPDSACIVFPRKVFRIVEEPLHVFQGHSGEILDISWSKNNVGVISSIL